MHACALFYKQKHMQTCLHTSSPSMQRFCLVFTEKAPHVNKPPIIIKNESSKLSFFLCKAIYDSVKINRSSTFDNEWTGRANRRTLTDEYIYQKYKLVNNWDVKHTKVEPANQNWYKSWFEITPIIMIVLPLISCPVFIPVCDAV